MMRRREGRVNGDFYEIVDANGAVLVSARLSEVRDDTKLAAAISRNGWTRIPEA